MYGLLHLVSRRIAADGGDARSLRNFDPVGIGVDDNDLCDIGASSEQFFESLLATAAKTREHDMIVQSSLNLPHAPVLPAVLEQKFRGRSEEDQPQEDADRRDQECVDQARPLAYRDDVAIADRRNGNHRQIDNVSETEVAVDIVPQTVPIEPQKR